MSKQTLNLGTAPAGADGDTVRGAFVKLEANMVELYGQLGASGSPLALPAALPITKGGTGGATLAAALAAMGLTGAYLRSNAIGTVGQASGVPTGALLEFGSNSNGQYLRFADGTQICNKQVASDTNTLTVGSALFGSNAVGSGAFPATFAYAPVVLGGFKSNAAGMVAGWAVAFTAPTQTNWGGWRSVSALSESSGGVISLVAIGRWYA